MDVKHRVYLFTTVTCVHAHLLLSAIAVIPAGGDPQQGPLLLTALSSSEIYTVHSSVV